MNKYDHKKIEEKWQNYWSDNSCHKVDLSTSKPYYCLDMFPYPSGEGLHVGHWSGYVYSDVWSRYMKLRGYEVLHPMGWDAFGLPAENAAIKNNTHPKEYTTKAIANFTRQLTEIGGMYDWSLEINSSSPDYYQWTQWLFLELFKASLAYRKEAPVNFCPSCKTVLANEQVVGGLCERCDSEVTTKKLNQWFFKITNFADQLNSDIDGLDWPEKVKKMQKNWIGRSQGVLLKFKVEDKDELIEVFTTRADTLFGATFLALAPESDLVDKLTTSKQVSEVKDYLEKAKSKSIKERKLSKKKTGVFTGSYAINPVNGKRIPIWISDYVLEEYGTGAIMAVPAHDQRDFEFAKKYNLNIIQVISSNGKLENLNSAYEGEGVLVNSSDYDGEASKNARETIAKDLAKDNMAEFRVNYKLNDWLISRQRYWGTPIPIVYCPKCGVVAEKEENLPIKLPEMDDFKPSKSGRSPLAKNKEFVNCSCPKCGGQAERETDTMDTFVDSSWYYLRYPNPNLNNKPFDKDRMKKWLPVDKYVGGVEHAVLHLLYARFITKALYKLGHIEFNEPFKSLFNQGMIYRDGKKMSKSVGNVVSPDKLVEKYGRDSLRGYELFIGPPEQSKEWNDGGIEGVRKYLDRLHSTLSSKEIVDEAIEGQEARINRLIKSVEEDLENFQLNTIVSSLMKFLNSIEKDSKLSKLVVEKYIIINSIVFPHICEELWQEIGNESTIFNSSWPKPSKVSLRQDNYPVVVQVNGKKRALYQASPQEDITTIKESIASLGNVAKHIDGSEVRDMIVVERENKPGLPPKLVNIITG